MASCIGIGNGGKTTGSLHSSIVSIPAGTDLFVVNAFRTILDANSPAAPTSCSVAAASATDVGEAPTGDQNSEWIKMYFLASPTSGNNTITIGGGGGTALDTGFVWTAYSGLTSPKDSSSAVNKITTTALAITTSVVAANCWAVGAFANQGASVTSFTNGVGRIFAVPNDGVGIVDSNATVATGSNTITINQTNQLSNGILASFPTIAATGTTRDARMLTLLGVG
jgi:hypothetical protein